MSATRFHIGDQTTEARSALVVQPSLPELLFLLSTLTTTGYDATVADTFKDAKHALATPPALLIADIRLGEFNGLHLVMRAVSRWPDLPTIVTATIEDAVLRREAEQLGATFIVLPTAREEMRAAIWRTVARASLLTQDPIRPPFERRLTERRVLNAPTELQERRQRERRQRLPDHAGAVGTP